jgi:pyruvate/2-oxoglutarate dehydrogenase complex dihydrolipoamide dehydrogenase (E3) component
VGEAYDLVVVGGGSAGLTGARLAAALGARVALVERDRLGGECLWTGCVPSKALLDAAAQVHTARAAARFGLPPVGDPADWGAVTAYVRRAVSQVEPQDSPEALSALGVDVVSGEARFSGRRSVDVDGRRLDFHHALIATGSRPVLPPVPGLATAAPLTTDTLWELGELPRRLLVLGGGPVGCELGQAIARFGSDVTLVEQAGRLLPTMDPDASRILSDRLRSEGLRVLTGTQLTHISATQAEFDGGTASFDRILVAAGRRPETDGLGLEAAGVKVDPDGRVVTDGLLRTTNPRIRAAGDVTGVLLFTHVAGAQAANAVLGALLGPRRRLAPETVPIAVFTDPEIAQVGLTAEAARLRHGPRVRVRTVSHTEMDRAVTEDRTEGFSRLVLDPQGKIVGATVVGPRAGEAIVELAHAVRRRWAPGDLAATLHPYPTHADGPWLAALAEVRDALGTPRTRRLTSSLLRLRRAWRM